MFALKRDFPDLDFSLNGGVESCHGAAAALAHCGEAGARLHGVMIGRAAYHYPWACLADADVAVFGAEANAAASRREVGPPAAAGRLSGMREGVSSGDVQRVLLRACSHAERCRRCRLRQPSHLCLSSLDHRLASSVLTAALVALVRQPPRRCPPRFLL